MLRIGITGGIGSGKTIVCSIFERQGVPVLYADQIAKEISDTDSSVKKRLKNLLGEEAYHNDGTLNRSFVASRLFSDQKIQMKINAIVHPHVQEEIRRRFDAFERGGEVIVIAEAALIYEAGLDKILDSVIVIEADEKTRVQRIVDRDGLTADAVRGRMKAQMDAKKKVQKADYVIRNIGSVHDLEASVRFLHTLFLQLAGGLSRG